MATIPEQIRPGQVITSDLMNAILGELARLGSVIVPGGTQVVPNVFGTFLGDARAVIIQPARQLAMGFTLDVSGAAVDPLAAVNYNLIVLNQSPPADTLVAPNTSVNLVVSRAAGGSTTPVSQPPTITRTETLSGTATTTFAVNATMVIVGTNFSANAAQNSVKFDGVAATVTSDPSDPTRQLFVVVPVGIPGAPVSSTDAAKSGVQVSVQIPNNVTIATTIITVNPPLSMQPTITSVSPLTQFETSDITIVGTNFSATAQVLIRDVVAVVVSATATQIVATVPDFADILPGSPVTATLKVVVPGAGEVVFSGTFRVRGTT